jgi:hypothetical protein
MDDQTYLNAFEAARRELEELTTKRAEMDGRIARLRETVLSLAYLVNKEGLTETPDVAGMGLTDAVAKVLRLSGMALTPAQIRDELARLGFNVKKYADIIPNITKVLGRLAAKGHVDPSVHGTSARKLYIWSPMQPNSFTFDDDITEEGLTEKVRQAFGRSLEDRIADRLKKKRREWARYLTQNGSAIVFANPPYFANGKSLSPRQLREVNEAIDEEKRANE